MRSPVQLASDIMSAFKSRDARRLRKLNDQVLVAASTSLERASSSLAVYSYVLSKIVSKPRYLAPGYSSALGRIERDLGLLVSGMPGADAKTLDGLCASLDRSIKELEKRDSRFLVDLMSKGKLKMAATMYAQGLSLGLASDATGVEKQEILDYAGSSMMFDRVGGEIGILERMERARRFLGK